MRKVHRQAMPGRRLVYNDVGNAPGIEDDNAIEG